VIFTTNQRKRSSDTFHSSDVEKRKSKEGFRKKVAEGGIRG